MFHNIKHRLAAFEKHNVELKISLIIGSLLIIVFIIFGIHGVNIANNPEAWDTTAYLGEANYIKNEGGITNFIQMCITGKYKQANQHPLYILLLTPFATTHISFFIIAKFISLAIGAVFLIIFFHYSSKLFGNLPAYLAIFLILVNSIFIEWTTLVATESLLLLFSYLSIFFIMEGFKENKYWIYAGIFSGLAFLAKGTTLIILPGFGVSAFIVYKLKILKNKYFWNFILAFIVITSPLLIRNFIVYDNPFFNVNNYIVKYGVPFLDEYRYVTFDPHEGATLWKFDQQRIDQIDSTKSIDKSDNILIVAKKIIKGILKEFTIFSDSYNKFHQYIPKILSALLSIIFLILFFIGLIRKNNFGGILYLLITMIIFFLILSFNPIDRYYLPLLPFVWIYIIGGAYTFLYLIINKLFVNVDNNKVNKILSITFIIILFLSLSASIYNKPIKNPFNSVNYSEKRVELLNWLRNNLKEGDKYTLGPNFNWQLENGTWILPPFNMKTKDFDKFNDFIKRYQVKYVIIEKNSLSDKKELINEYFSITPKEGIIEKKSIPNWNLVYKDQKIPVEFLVYELLL